MTKEKLVEILDKYKGNGNFIIKAEFDAIADEILPLHNAELAKLQERLDIQINVNDDLLLKLKEQTGMLAKYKELVETWKTLSDMQTDDLNRGHITLIK